MLKRIGFQEAEVEVEKFSDDMDSMDICYIEELVEKTWQKKEEAWKKQETYKMIQSEKMSEALTLLARIDMADQIRTLSFPIIQQTIKLLKDMETKLNGIEHTKIPTRWDDDE